MDVAREFTEKWHHTQQIFDATGRASTIVEKRLFQPCLETFTRALPCTFLGVDAAEGATVCVEILGAAGGEWWISRSGATWNWIERPNNAATAHFAIGQDSVWKLFTKRIDRATAFERFPEVKIEGDQLLAGRVAEMVSVMA